METKETKIWTKEQILKLLANNTVFVARAVAKLYEFQTLDEQQDGFTSCSNGVGFNGVDSDILSSFAEFFNERGYLSPKQTKIAQKKMVKYAGQLTKIANGKINFNSTP